MQATSLRGFHEQLDLSARAAARARSTGSRETTTAAELPILEPITGPILEPIRMRQFEFARHIPPVPQPRASEPSIQVTIGRIEVRAASAENAPTKPRAASPVMSLGDYLQRAKRGGQ
jgi:hypothetical protein